MVFIALLATAVGIFSALGLIVVGLVEAPWQLLLVGLLAALYGLQRQIWALEAANLTDRPLPPLGTDIAITTLETPQKTTGSTPPAASALEPSSTTSSDAPSSADEHGDELTYRGIRYRLAKPTTKASADTPNQVEGIYRGQRWQR
ncbi:hypothetical protein [Nodosilinea sp. E11]|uniref:hypothetical protein n=1 Tax=Nodosilinea sp. E11 TaxID=3037479 RepID=UPI00293460B2|nr:hypothetical protein [Nodosilinea sp. E11]WOD38351.1 hypothetical protein RRF56_19250 [Nodosilinea sp. E11]